MAGELFSHRYEIIEQITSNSLSALYLAHDLNQNHLPVLINVLSEKTRQRPLENLLRFKRQVESISKITHPYLLKIYSLNEAEGRDFLVMEYFLSRPLSDFIDPSLSIEQSVRIILQIASCLDVCHQKRLLHQAIQPENILVCPGSEMTVKLTNFGISFLVDLCRITEEKEIISTFGYLSPESSGILRKPLDLRSDIYSLGILFYQLLTRQLPYQARDVATLIHQHIATPPTPPSLLNNKIDPVLEKMVMRLIEKEPQERYQNLSSLSEDLQEYQKQKSRGKEKIDFEIARSDRLREISFATRLIGREKEREQLIGHLNQTKNKKGALCFIFGEPGIGKSRLVDEVRGHIHSLGGVFCGGKCYQYEMRTPYKVFSEAIEAYIEKLKRLPLKEQEDNVKRIREAVGELGGEVVKIAPRIKDLIGQPAKLIELEPEKERIRFLITITNFILSLSTPEHPLLMFLDDMQWADGGSLDILERLAEKVRTGSLVVIPSYRDNEVDLDHPLSQMIRRLKQQNIPVAEIPLKGLGIKETIQMLSQILLEKENTVSILAEQLNQKSMGNPFFILELLHTLMDKGIVYLKENHYVYDFEKLTTAKLPDNIVDMVLNRIKDISKEYLKVLSYASVMGKEIQFELLVELSRMPMDIILNSIEDGIKNQLMMRDITGRENVFFMHDRIREAFYQRVPLQERIPLHKHIAEVLEEQNKNNIEPVLYDLAYHFTEGLVDDKALQYCIPAARKAQSAYANALAIHLYMIAKEILERQKKTRTDEYIMITENMGEVYRLTGGFEESLQVLRTCETLIPVQDVMHKAQVLSKIGDTLFEMGEAEKSAQSLEQALKLLHFRLPSSKLELYAKIPKELFIQFLHRLFPRVFIKKKYKGKPSDILIIHLSNRIGYTYYFSNIIKVFYIYLRILNFGESKVGPCIELAHLYINGPPVWLAIPVTSFALQDVTRGLELAKKLDNKIHEGMAYVYLTFSSYYVNTPLQGLEHAKKAISLLMTLGEYWELGLGYHFRTHNSLISGRIKDAVQENQEFISLAKETKSLQTLGWGLYGKGFIMCLMGDINDGIIDDLIESGRLLKITRDHANYLYSLAILAFAYLRNDDHEQAIKTIEEVKKIFPAYYNKGTWALVLFPIGAQIYLDTIVQHPDLSEKVKKEYLNKAQWFCKHAVHWGRKLKYCLGWAYQVNSTYHWLTGHKRKAIYLHEKGVKFLREQTQDKYRLAYLLMEEACFLLKYNPKDKKALDYLLEAKELFTLCGVKKDLAKVKDLISSLTSSGELADSRLNLTQKRHLESLLSVIRAIGSLFDLDELLDKILDYSLKVTGAERGFLFLYDESKKALSLTLSRGLEKDISSLSFSYENYKISLYLIHLVQETKEAIMAGQDQVPHPQISDELTAYQIKEVIVVPLRMHEKLLGIIYLDNRLTSGTFGLDELELMNSFAVQASVSIENSYLIRDLVEQERLKQEMALGRQIQMNLLPKKIPETKGLELCGMMLPAKEIGGDYYDFITLKDKQKMGIVIGDVAGKGVGAGLLMAMVKTAIHIFVRDETSPKQILIQINEILNQHIEGERFITMLYLVWDGKSSTITYSSAGHEHILVFRHLTSEVEAIPSGGIILGIMTDIKEILEEKQIKLHKKDKILLYTDGVTEAHNQEKDRFSLARLQEAFKKHSQKPVLELMHAVKDELHEFIGACPQYDDITLVVMEVL